MAAAQGQRLARGDVGALKKSYHKIAAKVHPDRHATSSLAVRVQAEEVFKLISEAYAKEQARLSAARESKGPRGDDLSA